MDMGDTWGADGPPSEAYRRVTRDLAAVTTGFAAYLDKLPTRLVSVAMEKYACSLRARPGGPALPADPGPFVVDGPDVAGVPRTSGPGGARPCRTDYALHPAGAPRSP